MPKGSRSNSTSLSDAAQYLALGTAPFIWGVCRGQRCSAPELQVSVLTAPSKHNGTVRVHVIVTRAAPYVTSFLTHDSKSKTVGFIITHLLMPEKTYLLEYILENTKFTRIFFFLLQLSFPFPHFSLPCDGEPQTLWAVSQLTYA